MPWRLLNYLSNFCTMKIALIGYGGMGKEVERVAVERGHEVVVRDPAHGRKDSVEGCDVAIDFSLADAVEEDARMCAEASVPLVIGTTGWYDREDAVREASDGVAAMWSSNFSIGVNLYFKIVEAAAEMMNGFDEYDVWGHEIHHYNKVDSPSGTAKTLGKILVDKLDRKTSVANEKLDRRREPEEIHFSSVRGGAVNFGHTVGFDSEFDTITITHAARNRGGYALGAVKAAEWLVGQEPGWYGMQDFLNL